MTSDELKLKELAELMSQPQGNMVDGGDWMAKRMALQQEFRIAANPTAILSLLARVEELESNIELWSHQKAWLLKSHADLADKLAIAQQDKGKETV